MLNIRRHCPFVPTSYKARCRRRAGTLLTLWLIALLLMWFGRVWNTRFPLDLSASVMAATMFLISNARASANCSTLIDLGAWEFTAGVDDEVGAKPGIPLFRFLFRLIRSFSVLFRAFEDAMLVSESVSN